MTSFFMLVAVGMIILFLLLVFMPKRKKQTPVSQVDPVYQMPQYFAPQPQYVPPAPQLTLRQQEIQEKVRVLTTHYLDIEEDQFKKKVVDEALALLSQGK